MKSKKILSLLLALSMTAALSVPAFAGELTAPETATTYDSNEKDDGDGVQTEITGHIMVTQLKVTVPTAVAFNIDPNAEITSGTSQVKAAESKITNNSLVPVYTKISAVDVDTDISGATLVDQEVSLTTSKTVMLGYKKETCDLDTQSDWLMEDRDFDKDLYLLNSEKGKIAASEDGTTGVDMELTVSAATRVGWAAGNKFKVTPTIVVSAKEFTAAAE